MSSGPSALQLVKRYQEVQSQIDRRMAACSRPLSAQNSSIRERERFPSAKYSVYQCYRTTKRNGAYVTLAKITSPKVS
jgi:hypothetical protein